MQNLRSHSLRIMWLQRLANECDQRDVSLHERSSHYAASVLSGLFFFVVFFCLLAFCHVPGSLFTSGCDEFPPYWHCVFSLLASASHVEQTTTGCLQPRNDEITTARETDIFSIKRQKETPLRVCWSRDSRIYTSPEKKRKRKGWSTNTSEVSATCV